MALIKSEEPPPRLDCPPILNEFGEFDSPATIDMRSPEMRNSQGVVTYPHQPTTLKYEDEVGLHRQLINWCLVQLYWRCVLKNQQCTTEEYTAVHQYIAQMERDAPYLDNYYSPNPKASRFDPPRPDNHDWYPYSIRCLFPVERFPRPKGLVTKEEPPAPFDCPPIVDDFGEFDRPATIDFHIPRPSELSNNDAFRVPLEPGLVELDYENIEALHQMLCVWCLIQRYWYYVIHKPQVTDLEYDVVERYVKQLEDDAPSLQGKKDSPSNHVGSEKRHDYPIAIQRWFPLERFPDGNY